ncbi:MAG: flagellar hook-length control protein FliK [Pseudomonadota bacterium]|nr:flagellar hook-length control protein FliK [Pseudomonadota bacterium]
MNDISKGIGIQATTTATTLPHERRGDVPHAGTQRNDATVLTLTSASAGKPTQAEPGLASLYSLLQGLQHDELAELPPRTAHLLAELGRHLLPVTDVGNASRLRKLVLHNGLFMESTPGDDDVGDSAVFPAPLDLKSLLGQLLALMQPGRRLALRDGALQFVSLNPGTAQCLQAYAEEQKHGSRQKRFQGRLQANVETAFLGIVRNQLQSLAQSSDKKTRWIMDLVLQHERGPLTVPLIVSYQGAADPELWEAEFELNLRHCGPLHVVIGVKNTTVSVHITAGHSDTLDLLRNGRLVLGQILSRKGLTLGSYVCQRGHYERLAG